MSGARSLFPRELPLSIYVPGTTPLHRLNAGVKLLAVFTLIVTGTFTVNTPPRLLAFAVVVATVYVIAKIPPRAAWAQIAAPLPLLIALGLFQWWQLGAQQAAIITSVLCLCMLTAGLLPLTTTIEELMDGIEKGLRPFARFGVPAERVSLAMSLTLRLVPVQFAQVGEVLDARRARGAGFSLIAFATPVLIRALGRARALAEALAARGVGDD